MKNSEVRALIKVMGGPSIGMGHVMRSLELANELMRRGVAVIGFQCNEDRTSEEKIQSKGFHCDVSGEEELSKLIDERGVNFLLIDHPGELTGLCQTLRVAFSDLFIAALDQCDLDNERLDVIVNLFNHNPVLKVPTSEKVGYYEGLQYAVIRVDFVPYIHQEKVVPSKVENVLVSFGGSDPKKNTIKVVEALRLYPLKGMVFHFILGANFAHRDVIIEMLRDLETECQVHEDVPHIEELMYRCDLGLSGGGTTMMEMACLGTPAIVVAQNMNEVRFAGHFASHDAVRHLGLAEKVGADEIMDTIADLAESREERKRMSAGGKRLIDGRGCERIVTTLLKEFTERKKWRTARL